MKRIKIVIFEAFWVGLAAFFILWILESLIPGLGERAINHRAALGLAILTGIIGLIFSPSDKPSVFNRGLTANKPGNVDDPDRI